MPNPPNDMAVGNAPQQVIDKKTGEQKKTKQGLKWELIVDLPKAWSPNVKRPRKTKTFYGSKKAAERETQRLATECQKELDQAIIPSQINIDVKNMTFGQALDLYLDTKKDNYQIRTWEDYVNVAETHIKPMLGDILLKDITAFHLGRYRDIKLQDKRLDRKTNNEGDDKRSARTVNKHLSLISKVLDDAASDEKRLIPHNPAIMTKRAKETKSNNIVTNCLKIPGLNDLLYRMSVLHSMRYKLKVEKDLPQNVKLLKWLGFTDGEIVSDKLLFSLVTTTLYPISYLGARAGMRKSELTALGWPDIDFDNHIIIVYRSSHFSKKVGDESGHQICSLKEKKIKPYIQLSEDDINFLKQHKKNQEEDRLKYPGNYTDNNLVFCNRDGSYLRNDTIGKKFAKFASQNGYNISFHGLRHTHATALVAMGVPLPIVANRLGHQQASTTWGYSHAQMMAYHNLGNIFAQALQTGITDTSFREAQHKTEFLIRD